MKQLAEYFYIPFMYKKGIHIHMNIFNKMVVDLDSFSQKLFEHLFSPEVKVFEH